MKAVKFLALMFRSLPNEAHFKFFERATRELAKAGPAVITALGALVTELNDWFVKETDGIAWYRKSALTAIIADADARLDHGLVGMSAQVNSARYSADHDVAAAAERLYIMLKSYGRVVAMPYLQEAGAVRAILAHLKGDLTADATAVGLATWITEVEDALNAFLLLLEEREAQTLKKPTMSFPEVRRGIESVWHQIVILVNSGATLNVSSDFTTFINSLNPEIEYLNGEFHRAKQNIAAAQPAPIAQQTCTGEPITPVPEVLYDTGKGVVKLELGKDFNIAYKNNVNPGNADCIIRGKGKFKGSKTVTFIIK